MKQIQLQPLVKSENINQIVANEFYGKLIDSFQDYSIFTLNIHQQITSWSKGSTALFGYTSSEVIGKHFELIFTQSDREKGIPNTDIQKAQLKGKAESNRIYKRKDKSGFYAFSLTYPLYSVSGDLIGYAEILRDLTEKKKTEDAIDKHLKDLEVLNSHKESIISILSHDLRSPLARIISITQYLQKNFENIDSSEKKKLLNYLYDSSVEELNLLEHLVEWARIKYATDTYSPTKIDLYLYVTKVFDTLNPTASAKSIKLVSTIEPNISVFADGNMVNSMIQNIVSNAIKYAPIDSQILVLATKKQNNIIVEIRDSGIGMKKETISKLFTPQMATLSNSIKENEGAGIGLLLVKSLLEKNHGQIWVKSIVGVGTSFFFTLPINNLDIKKAS